MRMIFTLLLETRFELRQDFGTHVLARVFREVLRASYHAEVLGWHLEEVGVLISMVRTRNLHFAELIPVDFVEEWLIGISQFISLLRLGLSDFDLVGVADITTQLGELLEALLCRFEPSDGVKRRLVLPTKARVPSQAVIEHCHLYRCECIC